MKVFVYGTLKQGQGNHSVLDGAPFIEETETVKSYDMLHLGGYPGVIEGVTGEGTTIKGEVYEVEGLDRLDMLEGYPSLYYREEVELANGDTAWMYLYNRMDDAFDYQTIPNGVW